MAGTYQATTGSVGGGELGDAAEEIAQDARKRSLEWSGTVAESMAIEGDDKKMTVSFDAPAAYPNETGSRHPLFADSDKPRSTWTWTDKFGRGFSNHRPFLAPAADSRAGAAMAKYAKKIDRLCRDRGFKPE